MQLQLMGWKVLRYMPEQDGECMRDLEISEEGAEMNRIEVFNDHFQNSKKYGIPKAQLLLRIFLIMLV